MDAFVAAAPAPGGQRAEQLLRASTAAPTFFPPEQIRLGDRTYAFMDGGITPYNNPALITMLMATLPQYRLEWTAGRDDLLLISIGTGGGRTRLSNKPITRLHLIDHLAYMPPALLSSISEQQDTLCRILGHCIHGDQVDLELGGLYEPSLFSRAEQKFSYVRYNTSLAVQFRLDDLTQMQKLREVGREYAESNVKIEHLRLRAAT